MKLFIAIDLEGISGVVTEADTAREGAAAERARAHMRADLDAVLEGCAAAGARDVVICDAHDDGRNLDPSDLPGFATLVSGSPAPLSMLEGLGPDRDGALFVGYHAMAGTQGAVLEHTWNYKVYAARVGELEVGEFGIGALLAGEFGVPALYLSGDDKAAAEAQALVPGIATTVVKTGVRREAAGVLRPRRGARPPEGGRGDGAHGRRTSRRRSPGAASRSGSPSPASSSATSPRPARGRRGSTGARWRSRGRPSPRSTRASSPACGSPRATARRGGAAGRPQLATPPPLWSDSALERMWCSW